AKELEILKCLLDNDGQVLTRMQIIDYVWKDSEEIPYDRVVDVNAKELEILKCLLDNDGQVLTRMQIIDYVWKDSEEIPYDRV
ncbi:winged helix-turn-helix domain-containing protein, partial [Streptococcus agalactiae]